MASPFKLSNVILCEHIVEGVNNKHTLINTYSGDILVSEMPANIPIAFYLEMMPIKDYAGELELTLKLGKETIVRGKADVDLKIGTPGVTVLPMGMLIVAEPATLQLFLGVVGEKPVKALERKFSLMPK